jgi:type IV conjugative transfer system coupling protein TraD
MNILSVLAEGGQTWAHRVRMIRQVIKIAVMSSLFVGILVFAVKMTKINHIYYQALWYYGKSISMGLISDTISVDKTFWEKITHEGYSSDNVSMRSTRVTEACEKYVQRLQSLANANFASSTSISIYSFGVFILFFLGRGLVSRKKKHISGKSIVSTWPVAIKLRLTGRASDIKVGSLPLVKGTETQHILVSGGTGSGKTNCFHHILPKIQRKKKKAVIVDTTGTFVSKYYREGKDILLNPFDSRSVTWHPWIECRETFDYDSLAASFIPHSNHDQENFWRNAARSVFSAVLQKTKYTQKISDLTNVLLYESLNSLSNFVQGTKACAHLDVTSEKTAGSIRSVATSYIESLEFLKDTGSPFSIREWMENEETDSWLFLYSKVGQRASLNPLISSWFSIAIRSLLQMEPDIDRRVWFVADELPSLQKLKDLDTFLTESRKFGGCALMAIQSPAQLEMIYGFEAAKIILGNCSTRIAFFEQDPEVANKISKGFGEKEIREVQEGISYGANEVRDGVSLSSQTRSKPTVTVSDIQSLEKHEAYIKLPGNLPIVKTKLSLIT